MSLPEHWVFFPLILLGCSFPSHSGFSCMHTQIITCPMLVRYTCYRFMEFSIWLALSSIVFWLANSVFLSLPALSAQSPQPRGSARLGLVSLSLYCILETSHRSKVGQGSPSFQEALPFSTWYLMSWKLLFHIFHSFFGCFYGGGNSGLYYSILARSRHSLKVIFKC